MDPSLCSSPITDVIVVSDHNKVPIGYTSIIYTVGNAPADVGYDGSFLSPREYRYLAYARQSSSNGKSVLWVSDLKLSDKDMPGFTSIERTTDSNKPAFKKHRLCVKKIQPEKSTNDFVVINIKLMTSKENKSQVVKLPNLMFVGEVNQLFIFVERTSVSLMAPLNHNVNPKPLQQFPAHVVAVTLPAQLAPSQPARNGSFRQPASSPGLQRSSSIQKDPLAEITFQVRSNSASEQVKNALESKPRENLDPIRLRQFIDGQADYNFRLEHIAMRAQSSN